MAVADITNRTITVAKQSAMGTRATATDGKYYGFRPDTAGGLSKESFESDSIRTDQQYGNPRQGLRSAAFTLSQELQIGGHNMLLEGALRAAFAAGGSSAGSTDRAIDVTARTITRTSGSFITDGFKVGDIIRAAGFADTDNNGVNLRLTAVTALVLTYAADDWLPAGMATEAAGASVTLSTPGKKLQVPSSSHTKDYFTIEDWHGDINHSTVIDDARISQVAIDISPGAHATISFQFLGRDCEYGATEYFNTQTAAPTGALLAGPEGLLRYAGADSAVVTGVQITIDEQAQVKGVVGANVSPDVFTSGVKISGSISSLFDGGAILTNFEDGSADNLFIYLFADTTAASEFLTIKIPRASIQGADKSNDGTAVSLSGSFAAGKETTSTTLENTTIVIHDSSVA